MSLAIIVALVAILLPTIQWAASGHIQLPVRVLVFDAVRGRPIANAHVGIFRALPLDDLKSLQGRQDEYRPRKHVPGDDCVKTSDDGAAVINYEFATGANHERPTMYVHLTDVWVNVAAEGYGSIVVPVRYESAPRATLQKQKEIVVSIGLIRTE